MPFPLQNAMAAMATIEAFPVMGGKNDIVLSTLMVIWWLIDGLRWFIGWLCRFIDALCWFIMVKNDYLIGGLEHEFYDFPNSWDDDPVWRTHMFQRGRHTTNQIRMCSTEILVYNMIYPREIWIKPTKVGILTSQNDLKLGMLPSKWGCIPGSSVDLMWS